LRQQKISTHVELIKEDISSELTNSIISTLSQISSLAKNEINQSTTNLTPSNQPPLTQQLLQSPKQIVSQNPSSVFDASQTTSKTSQPLKISRQPPIVPTRTFLPVQTVTSPTDINNFSNVSQKDLPVNLSKKTEETTKMNLQQNTASESAENNHTNTSSSNLSKKLVSIATHESSSTASSSYSSSNSNVSLLNSSSSQESHKKALNENQAETSSRQQAINMSTFRSQHSNNSSASNTPSVSRQNSTSMTTRRNSSSQNSECIGDISSPTKSRK